MKPINDVLGEPRFLIKWEPKYELGIPSIDNQHKKLVELCDKFYQSILAPSVDKPTWQTNLMNTLRECAQYVQTHFHDEEVIMQAAGYEGYAAQKAQHDGFTKKVLETADSFQGSDLKVAIKFAKFLYEWILSHISYEDKKYVPCVMEYIKRRK